MISNNIIKQPLRVCLDVNVSWAVRVSRDVRVGSTRTAIKADRLTQTETTAAALAFSSSLGLFTFFQGCSACISWLPSLQTLSTAETESRCLVFSMQSMYTRRFSFTCAKNS